MIDRTDAIIAYEEGGLTQEETVELFQGMIDDGSVWQYQGHYGRMAMSLLESGDCILGPVAYQNAFCRIPSRTDVTPGTMGSVEYQQKMKEGR